MSAQAILVPLCKRAVNAAQAGTASPAAVRPGQPVTAVAKPVDPFAGAQFVPDPKPNPVTSVSPVPPAGVGHVSGPVTPSNIDAWRARARELRATPTATTQQQPRGRSVFSGLGDRITAGVQKVKEDVQKAVPGVGVWSKAKTDASLTP